MAAKDRHLEGIHTKFLGVRDKSTGKVVAATLIETRGSGLATYCVIHDGPLCDFDNRELTVFFLHHLARYARSQGAVHLDITPEQPYRIRDSRGKKLANHAPDTAMMSNLAAAGMIHQGFTRGYSAVPRWRFVKDLTGIDSGDKLLASYTKQARRNVTKRAQPMAVHVRQIGESELPVFESIVSQTARRRHFDYRGKQYFHQFYESYGKHAHFMLAEIDTHEFSQLMQEKADRLAQHVKEMSAEYAKRPTMRLDRQLKKGRSDLKAARRRVDQAHTLLAQGPTIPIDAALFVDMPQEVVYLFSGSMNHYKAFCGSALLQYEAMLQLCVKKGIKRYNFYGIDGIFDDPHDEGRGVLEFKQIFNGYVEELPGTFMRVLRPFTYRLEQVAHRLLKRR